MGDYDDDFEDYDDDDFEDDEEPVPSPTKAKTPKKPAASTSSTSKAKSPVTPKNIDPKVLEMRRAMEEENKKANTRGTSKQQQSSTPTKAIPSKSSSSSSPGKATRSSRDVHPSTPTGPTRRFVDPTASSSRTPKMAKSDREALTKHRRRRWEELKGKISLSISGDISVCDMAPLTKYELYARGLTRESKESSSCQCPDEAGLRHQDTQSDKISTAHVSMQAPEDIGKRSAYEHSRQKEMAKHNLRGPGGLIGQDTSRLVPFLQRVEKVMVSVLSEPPSLLSRDKSLKAFQNVDSLKTSSSSYSIESVPVTCKFGAQLKGRPIIATSSLANTHITVVFGPAASATSAASKLSDMYLICTWGVGELSNPRYTMATHHVPRHACVAMTPRGAVCVSGGQDGILCLWDLEGMGGGGGESVEVGAEGAEEGSVVRWRLPSWCTEPSSGARAETTVHTTAIIGLEILSSQEASGPLALQVVSCDESGVVYLWDVLHLAMPSQDGIAVGGKVKLQRSGGSNIHAKARGGSEQAGGDWNRRAACCLGLRPDSRDLVVGMEDGTLYHTPRYGGRLRPGKYLAGKELQESLSAEACTCISFSPFPTAPRDLNSILSLVGSASGTVSLYLSRRPYPIKVFDGFTQAPVIRVLWSKTRPAVFVALDAASKLHFFNLLKDDAAPVHVESAQDSKIVDVCMPDPSPTARGVKATIAVGFITGHVQVHTLASMFAEPIKDEEASVRNLVESWLGSWSHS